MVSLSNHEATHHNRCEAFMVRQAHYEGQSGRLSAALKRYCSQECRFYREFSPDSRALPRDEG